MQPALTYADRSEAEVVAAARAGEADAFLTILRWHNQQLFRVARGITGDDVEAEDVLQESYVRAFARLDQFRGEAALATWLTRIVINEARGRLRSRKITVDLEQLETDPVVVGFSGREPADPEADAARAQIRRLVEKAVDRLPEAFRVVFILREVEELSIEETAAKLGLKPET